MEIKIKLNGKMVSDDIPADMLLIDFVRAHNCFSVKRGCETSSCGLCTVLLDDQPVLSCSMLAARADGHSVYTLEGLQEEASEFVGCRPRRRAVWLLQPWLCDEHHCFASRKPRSHG